MQLHESRRPPPLAFAALPLAVLAFCLRGPLSSLGAGPWGPADPWLDGDFNGGWWLWWASSETWRGRSPWRMLDWPHGVERLAAVIPNPGDMLLLGLAGPPSPLAWNLVQLAHLVLLVLGAWFLARAAGAGPPSASAAASLVAASPVLLHEVAGGRPSSLVAWPGLFALALLLRGRWLWAGLLAAAQGAAYAWNGLALLLLGLVLVRDRRAAFKAAAVGALAVAPYVAWLLAGNGGIPVDRPAAGYTALPLAGLWGMGSVPSRFRLHPLLLPVALLGLRGGRRWLVAAALGLVLAVGPRPTWALGQPLGAGPAAWAAWAWPPLARMHHPVRATLLVLPVLATGLALGLDRFPRRGLLALALVAAAFANHRAVAEATSWKQPPRPPFAGLEIPGPGPAVDLLGMRQRTALSLQTFHRHPLLEPLWFRRPRSPAQDIARALAAGEDPGGHWPGRLASAGFRWVLLLDRFGDGAPAAAVVEEALGPAVRPGVYALPGAGGAE